MAQLNIAGSPTTTRHIKLYLLDFYRAIPQRHITFRIEASSSERATIRAASVSFSELKPGIAGLPTCTEPVEGACPTLQGEAPPWPDLVEVSFPPYEFTPSTPLLTFHSLLSTGDGDTKAASPLACTFAVTKNQRIADFQRSTIHSSACFSTCAQSTKSCADCTLQPTELRAHQLKYQRMVTLKPSRSLDSKLETLSTSAQRGK